MSNEDLLLDHNIRLWVFLPIVIITFFIGIVRHYMEILLTGSIETTLIELQDQEMLKCSKLLRKNGNYLPRESFEMRRDFFTNDVCYFKTEKRVDELRNSLTMLRGVVKHNFFNVLPMIIIGGYINYIFSGFLTTRIPFELKSHFKAMCQEDIEIESLNPSWVSSMSWYFLNLMGLNGIHDLVLNDDGEIKSDESLTEIAGLLELPTETETLFKAEWESLKITVYESSLCNAFSNMLMDIKKSTNNTNDTDTDSDDDNSDDDNKINDSIYNGIIENYYDENNDN